MSWAAGPKAFSSDTLGPLLDDPLGQAADGLVFGEAQDIAGHLDGRPVVGEHLDDEVVGDALGKPGGGHGLDHLVQGLVKTA